jgi:hypothetical protein
VVTAGLERDVEGRAARVGGPAGGEGLALGVRLAVGGVEALAEHLAVLGHDRPDERVRRCPPAAALGELDGPREVLAVGLQKRAHGMGRGY